MSWKPEYAILMLIATVISYYCAIKISTSKTQKLKKIYLWIGIISTLSILFTFKYFNFFNQAILDIFTYFSLNFNPIVLNILLPVGISFYTFQSISYLLDVYWKKLEPEKHFGLYALYISFFPQLVAGPIERATHLLPQFRKTYKFDFKDFIYGIEIMMFGFFMKLVIADRLSILVDQVYNNIHNYTGLPLIIATYFFAYQIFCDFAAYSLIAIGTAKMMGFDLMENFKRPYFSKSISEFWRRWHISLSTWFKDYLYIPLGGSRVKVSRIYFNLMVIFVVSGIWHGANWTFIIWGFLHAIYMIVAILISKPLEVFEKKFNLYKYDKIYTIFKILVVFHIVLFGWIFFRANNIVDAFYIISNLFDIHLVFTNVQLGMGWIELCFSIFLIFLLETIHYIQEKGIFKNYSENILLRIMIINLLLFSILLFGVFSKAQFLYFQF